ncbi:hypothetical protein tinsulaeT_06450 [Thalassotalea insulae]|uniref:diguanylate cyclase n=1 Tax=Thalassotalea insulae TaxID=2056778 RepID=A0ABQ6GS99_9GAMM|nr:hypothetical protein tinsulaeT_06450 [Thalassotalea insulae]
MISGIYTLNYLLVLQHTTVAMINLGFTLLYLVPLYLNAKHQAKLAKTWLFILLMVHIAICTNLYVSNLSGFHLYYFLVPTGAFLLFNLEDKTEKIALSVLASLLYLYCENTPNNTPLLQLSEQMNHLIYQSVVLVNMIEVVIVLTLFVKQIENNEQQLRTQATTDALTGIANRRYFFQQTEQALAQAKLQQRSFSVLIIDFDLFKQINDNYGHFSGDACLKQVCSLIKDYIRQQDLFARLGGEEFVLSLVDTNNLEAILLAEKLCQLIANYPILIDEDTQINCTVSIGVASLTKDNDNLDTLLNQADKALYQAKDQGRNRVLSANAN